MTDRHCAVVLAGLLCMGIYTTPARGAIIEEIIKDTIEVNSWPCPYLTLDKEAVRAPFPIMIQNAWRRQNLLADYHFSATSNELTHAGQYKVRTILTMAPPEHRTVFVRAGESPEQTAARLNSVRSYAAKLPLDGVANIVETNTAPLAYPAGWPGAKEPALLRKFQSYVPDKMYLPDRSSGGTIGQ
jgi:hypothetical protein